MKIPAGDKRPDRFRRYDFFVDLLEKCAVTREDRRALYAARRLAFLYGNDGGFANNDLDIGTAAPVNNRIYPHIDQLVSFLYSQATTSFSTEVGVAVPTPELSRIDTVDNYVNDQWHRSNMDLVYGNALTWALVFGCTFIKPMWRGNTVYPGIVFPHNVGVLREDEMMLSRQEAFCTWYSITESQFRNDFALLPRVEPILARLDKRQAGLSEGQETGVDRIILTAMHPLGSATAGPQGTGMSDWLSVAGREYVPRVKENMIEMVELVVWDDALGDYRLVTLAAPDVVIFDRPLKETGWLAHEPPLIAVCPNSVPNYFWGISEVAMLMPLQRALNRALAQIEHLQGVTIDGDDASGIAPAAAAARDADVVIAFLGDRAGLFGRGTSGEGCDAANMRLPGRQQELLERLLDSGTPVVAVLVEGRPYALGTAPERAAAILTAFLPGEEGASALAGVLSGRVQPSGRLPVSIPATPDAQPYTYLGAPLAQRSGTSNIDPTARYAFGHGLSYTSFEWDELSVPVTRVPTDGSLSVGLTVRNAGQRAGVEVIQLYLHDPVASVVRPVNRLIGYARVPLDAGESVSVTFDVPAEISAFSGRDGRRVVEPGALELRLGASSADLRLTAAVELTGETRVVDHTRKLHCEVKEERPAWQQ